METYGVKVIYRHEAGEDVFYEESVISVKADSFDEAWEKAMAYAHEQCEDDEPHINPYGETVKSSVLEWSNVFIVDKEEDDDVFEIYSRLMKDDLKLPAEEINKSLIKGISKEEGVAFRYREFNAAWTRREMKVMQEISRRQPISEKMLAKLLKGSVAQELESLQQKELIELSPADSSRKRAPKWRTTEKWAESFGAEDEE